MPSPYYYASRFDVPIKENTMKAPDKIYLNTPKIQPELDNTTWDTKPYADCKNVEYIRKDTLLEWARERLDFACALKSEGQKTVCRELIDKIESL